MRLIFVLVLVVVMFVIGFGVVSVQEKVLFEWGDVLIDQLFKVDMFCLEKDQDMILCNFQKQLLLILYSVKGYNIMQNFNKCMDCYFKECVEEIGVIKVVKFYYLDCEDKKLLNILLCCYFCMQCYVLQYDVKLFVVNIYKLVIKKGE